VFTVVTDIYFITKMFIKTVNHPWLVVKVYLRLSCKNNKQTTAWWKMDILTIILHRVANLKHNIGPRILNKMYWICIYKTISTRTISS
jgi:hypothetical protein